MKMFIALTSFLFFLHTCVHKEQRFLIGAYQIIVIIAGVGLYHTIEWVEKSTGSRRCRRMFRIFTFTVSVYITLYCFYYYEMVMGAQRVDVPHYIRREQP